MRNGLATVLLVLAVVGCAIATGSGPASVTINRYLDLSAISTVASPAATAASGARSASQPEGAK